MREGSFSGNSGWLILIHWWMREYPSGQAAEEAKVAGQIYPWLWEVCTTKLLATPIQLGGPGTVVQIDESFCYEPCMVYSLKNSFVQKANKNITVLYRLQYHRGDQSQQPRGVGIWNGGCVSAMGIHADCSQLSCPNSASNHSRAHLTQHKVHSDQWQSYSRVPNVSSYSAVNHSLHFVDPGHRRSNTKCR